MRQVRAILRVIVCLVGISRNAVSVAVDETWYRIEFDGQAAGHEILTLQQFEHPDRGQYLKYHRETVLRLKRFGQDLSVRASLVTEETPDGLLWAWKLQRSAADGAQLNRSGEWSSGNRSFRVREIVGMDVVESTIECSEQPRSPLIGGWLLTAMAQDRKTLSTQVFFPESGGVAELQIDMKSRVRRVVSDQARGVLELTYEFRPPEFPEVEPVTLAFRDGILNGSEQAVLGGRLIIERTEPAKALGYQNTASLDLQLQTMIPVNGLVKWSDSGELLLQLQMSAGLRGLLQATEFQQVSSLADGNVELLLRDPASQQERSKPRKKLTPEELAEYQNSGRWIDSANAEIQRAGNLAAGAITDPQQKCDRLLDYVRSRMHFSAFSTLQQPASAVLKSWTGDCTEHAVLLSALLRSQQIPARVAVGFLFVPKAAAFAPHMWVEALIDGVWIPLDSTLPLDNESLPRIRVSHSSLAAEVSGCVGLFANLMDFPGQVEVTVLSDQPFSNQPQQ